MSEVVDDGHMHDFERFGKVTASLVGAILRAPGAQSRKWAWRVITGREPEKAAWHDLERGIEHEGDAVNALEIELGLLASAGRFVPHPTIPWLGASPDGFVAENGFQIPVECKCPRKLHDGLPPLYVGQVQTQTQCCQAPYAYFVSWVEDSDAQFVVKVMRDDAWWAENFPIIEAFYNDYVLPDIEPPKSPRRTKVKEKKDGTGTDASGS